MVITSCLATSDECAHASNALVAAGARNVLPT